MRRSRVLSAVVVLAALASLGVWRVQARKAAMVAELERELDARRGRRLPAPVLFGEAVDGDAFEHYRAALALVVEQPTELIVAETGDPAELTAEARAALEAYLERCQPAIDAMLRGTSCGYCVDDVAAVLASDSNLDISGCRDLAAAVQWRVRRLASAGRHPEAIRLSLQLGRFGQDVARRTGALVPYLTGIAFQMMALEGIASTDFGAAGLDDGFLADVTGALGALCASSPSPAEAVAGERLFFLGIVGGLNGDASLADETVWRRLAWELTWGGHDRLLRAQEAACREPLRQARATHRALLDRSQGAWLPRGELVFDSGKLHAKAAEVEALLAALETAVAVRRHRLRHGAWPASLDSVDRALLPSVPQDPFAPDGAPLRFLAPAEGAPGRVWSIGADGIDGGGEPEDRADLVVPIAAADGARR